MVFETTDVQPQGVPDKRVRIEASTSYSEVSQANHVPMRQASPTNETGEEFGAVFLEDGEEMIEVSEEMVKDWEARRARAEEEVRQGKEKAERLKSAMECGICLAVIRNPQVLSCGHSACNECLRSWWTRPIDGSEDPIVSTDDEDYEDDSEIVPRPRRRFYSAVKRTKVCPTCRKVITRRPAPGLVLSNIVKTLYGLSPVPRRIEGQRDESTPPKDTWRGIFPEEPEHPPTDPEEVNRQRREEVLQIRLELEESLERHHQELEATVTRINRLQILISEQRNEAVERLRTLVDEY